jgi:hypothetical protein
LVPLYFSSISFLSSSRTFCRRAVRINLTGSGAAALANSIALAFPIPADAPVMRIYVNIVKRHQTVLFARFAIVRVEYNDEVKGLIEAEERTTERRDGNNEDDRIRINAVGQPLRKKW